MSVKKSFVSLRMTSKLRLLNLLVVAAFFLLLGIVFIAFLILKNLSLDIATHQVEKITTTSVITGQIADIYHNTGKLRGGYHDRPIELKRDAKRLSAEVEALRDKADDPSLKSAVVEFGRNIERLTAQYVAVNIILNERSRVDLEIFSELEKVERKISEVLIDGALQGDRPLWAEQLLILVMSFKERLLEVTIQHIELMNFDLPHFQDNHICPVATALDELQLRVETTTAVTPGISLHFEAILQSITQYKSIIDNLHVELMRMRMYQKQVEEQIKIIQKDFSLSVKDTEEQIRKVVILTAAGVLTLVLVVTSLVFIVNGYIIRTCIHKPMSGLLDSIASFGRGDLDTPVALGRSDEWLDIENGLNKMASALQTSQQKKEELKKELFQSQKMEAIGTLAGGIAHDFNNILSGVIGCAELARDEVSPGSSVDRELNNVIRLSTRASDLVKQILIFGNKREQEKKLLHPQLIVKEVLQLLRSTIPSSISIVTDIDPDSEGNVILGSSIHIHQVIMNLCTNALQAMAGDKGTLTIRLLRKELDKEQLPERPDVLPGLYIVLEVNDTGKGMDQATRERIFEPYFSTRTGGDGTGLGLSVTHKIVEEYNGFIKVVSAPGKGSTMSVYFPAAEHDGSQPEIDPREKGGSSGVQAQILVVDDEELLVRITKKRLEGLGHHVVAVSDSRKALEIFCDAPDKIDLLITDQTMPGLTGTDLVREIHRINPRLPVIMCTGHSDIISEEGAIEMGISRFILKPLQKDELLDAVEETLACTPAADERGEGVFNEEHG